MLLAVLSSASAQLSFEATSEYGKLWDITYDAKIPNKLYARTLVNHIMVSIDNGSTWNIMYTFPHSGTYLSQLKLLPGGKALAFTAINNPDPQKNALYILDLATNTIRQHFVTPNYDYDLRPWVSSYDVYDSAAQTVLMNTSYMSDNKPFTEVYYTKDGGTNWKMIYYSGDYNTVQILNGVISPDNPAKIFLSRGFGAQGEWGGLFISEDAGDTWTEHLSGIPIGPVEFNPRNAKDIFVGTSIAAGVAPEALYHSLDDGKSFTEVPVSWADETLNNINVIQYDPVDSNIVWMMDENEMLKSTDKGKTWKSTVFEPNSTVFLSATSISINPHNNNQLFITSDAWPQYSADGGKTLTQVKNPFYLTSRVALAEYTNGKMLFYSSQGGYLSEDLATRKTKAYNIQPPYMFNTRELTVIPDETVPGRLFVFKPSDGYVSSSEFYYSNDYGATLYPLPTEYYSTGMKFIRKDTESDSHYWITFSYGNSYSSLFILDIGDLANPVVTPVIPPEDGIFQSALVNGQHVYLSSFNKLFLSEDGGLSWTLQGGGLEVLTDDYDVIWDIQVNPFNKDEMAIVTTQGVFLKKVGSNNWSHILVENDLRKIAFSDAVNGHMMTASYASETSESRIMFSTDSGEKWSTVNAPMLGYLQCTASMDIKFYTDHADIYFATADLGIVKYQLNNILQPQLQFLHSFDGYLRSGDAQLIWKTHHEAGLHNYQLERSTNNIDFSLINTQSATNSDGVFSYSYDDLEFSSLAASYGNVYYRLKLLSNDSSFAYSDTVKLSARDMYIFPVPAGNTINLRVEGVTEPAQYKVLLVDLLGRQYNIQRYNISPGTTTINMPISRLASGMYIMQVEIRPGEIRKFKFIKQ